MKAYYDVTNLIKDALLEDKFVNNVINQNEDGIDKSKQVVYPLSNIRVDAVAHEDAVLRLSMVVNLMDIVDVNKDNTEDEFTGNNNEQDVFNTQLAVGVRLIERLRRSNNVVTGDVMQFDGFAQYQPIYNEYGNGLYGWRLFFDILYNHEMTACEFD